MNSPLSAVISSAAKAQLQLTLKTGKGEGPCMRRWESKFYSRALASVSDMINTHYSGHWEREGIEVPMVPIKEVSIDYFAFGEATSPQDDQPNVLPTDSMPKLRLCRDPFEGAGQACPTILLGKLVTGVPSFKILDGMTKAFSEDLKQLEIAALISKVIYGLEPAQIACILLFAGPEAEESGVDAGKSKVGPMIGEEDIQEILDWMLGEDAKEIFPLLHEVAKANQFLIINAELETGNSTSSSQINLSTDQLITVPPKAKVKA